MIELKNVNTGAVITVKEYFDNMVKSFKAKIEDENSEVVEFKDLVDEDRDFCICDEYTDEEGEITLDAENEYQKFYNSAVREVARWLKSEKISVINNREELLDKLCDMLMEFEKENNSYYPTNVYAYYDEDTRKVTLDTFANPGGNSWRDDDHVTIYTDKEHYEDLLDFADEPLDFILDVLEITEEELKKRVADHYQCGIEEIEYIDIEKYVLEKEYDAILQARNEWIDENKSDYYEQAEFIISEYEDRIRDSLTE